MQHKILADYEALKTLIEQRQAFEAAHPIPPYITHPTTINYANAQGLTLLQLAAAAGDLEKVKECVARGANVNLESANQPLPIASALKSGEVEVAKFLFEQGANCQSVGLHDCGSEACKEWFLAELEKVFNQTYPDIKLNPDRINYIYIARANRFFNDSSTLILSRLVELEKYDLIKHVPDSSDAAVLIAAIKYKKTAFISKIMSEIKDVNVESLYTFQPIHAAIKAGDIELVMQLLKKGANINAQNMIKFTSLLDACENSNEELVQLLLEHGADTTLKTIDGDTALHIAARENAKIFAMLLQNFESTKLKYNINIYGESPLDIAIQYKNDEVIKLLSPGDLEKIKTSKEYGNKPVRIDQHEIIENFSYYLRNDYRDTSYFSRGYCNGLIYLFLLYSAMRKEAYFYDTLRLLASWDKNIESLKKPFPDDLPQAKFYKNLGELFEQWINDSTVFQALSVEGIFNIPQNQRKRQHQLISRDNLYEPTLLFSEFTTPAYRSKEQLREMFAWLFRMPPGVRIDIAGAQHATAGY